MVLLVGHGPIILTMEGSRSWQARQAPTLHLRNVQLPCVMPGLDKEFVFLDTRLNHARLLFPNLPLTHADDLKRSTYRKKVFATAYPLGS